ncbi:Protein CBG02572 [Caenorhabditis briggsae]|uniref:Tripeptidyl-peptidase 2 n=1 Tax=Caenorhabditis briggsae TaxID=6238 RepID=A8WU07_CAEBR|nr:Protein CBG02572 [Caenorhabditis briggsae]CAP23969.1 Protein CBG02572 [Caenorhabditis briggsae]
MIVIRNGQRISYLSFCRFSTRSLSTQQFQKTPLLCVLRPKVATKLKMSSTPPEIVPQQPLDALLLNKTDTEQEMFLTKYPTYDGRDILIAILDTGVDPSLPGMQVTTTGERKVFDVIDCSGAGDVDTSATRTVKDKTIEGISGRKLTIPDKWTNPTGVYHVGLKPIFELYTKGVKSRVVSERKEDVVGPSHNLAAAEALKELVAHEKDVGGTSEKTSDKWTREDLACKVDFLKSMASVSDVGPVADVITWHDGDVWRVCIDTSFRGRLGMCNVLGTFRETGDYACLTDKDSVVYTVRVSPDGNLTEIVVPSGAHGSHVAGIAAANYPDNPQKNGLAPGAKILSLNIGDHRLAAMETGQAMTRAFNMCAELNVDVINMSFGEGTHLPDVGRVVEEARRLIDRKDVIYVCSAGNQGPALSTVGAPGGTTTGVIGIGAYLTSESADTLYGVYKPVDNNIYPWSSRGPCQDGKLGVSLVAPAAAFAGVPQYCRQSMQMMNGTSMSSPNAAGNVACMLSGLKQLDLKWTPYTVRMALENTAFPLPNVDAFSQGQGMIKIATAFDKLSEILINKVFPSRLTHFEVKVADHCKKSKGIYIREPKLNGPQEFTVGIEPIFKNHQEDNNLTAIGFEKQVILQSTAPWVSHPQTMFVVAQERPIVVTVDASKAPKGASYAEIVGIDTADPSLGPIFRIPVSVIVPETVDVDRYTSKLVGKSGAPERRFVQIPSWATSAKITLKSTNKDEMDRFTLHTVYIEDDKCSRNTEAQKIQGPVGNEWAKSITVKGGKTLEACVVRAWSRGKTTVDVDMTIDFFGVQKPSSIALVHGSTNTPIRIQAAPTKSIDVAPAISLTNLVVSLKPQSAKVEPLGARDLFLTSGLQINRLLLTYQLKVAKTSEVQLELGGLTPYLYESSVDCVLFQIFGANKSYIGAASSYPDRWTQKLEKGEYTIQAQVRYPDEQVLLGMKELPLLVRVKLGSKVSVDLAASAADATFGKESKFTGKALLPNQEMTLYAMSVSDDKLPKGIVPTSGSFLIGSFSALKDSDLSAVDKSQVVYYLSEYSARAAKGLSMVTVKKEKNQKDEMTEAIRDLEVSWVQKLTDEKTAKEFFETCLQKYPDHLPLLTNRVKQLMQTKLADQTDENVQKIIELCGKILELTKPNEVLQFLSVKQEHDDDLLTVEKWLVLTGGTEAQRKECAKMIPMFNERKNAIIIALQTLASLEQDREMRRSSKNIPASLRFGGVTPLIFGGKQGEVIAKKSDGQEELKSKAEQIDAVVAEELKKIDENWTGSQFYVKLLIWLSADDSKAALVSSKHAAALGQFGRCAKLLNKAGEELKASATDSQAVDTSLAEICENLEWNHLSTHFKNLALIKNRASFRLF